MTPPPFIPNVTPPLLEKRNDEDSALVVPALTRIEACVLATVTDAVIVEPFMPNETLLLLLQTTVPALWLEPAALAATPPPPPAATLASTVTAFAAVESDHVTLEAFENARRVTLAALLPPT
jgi:hypothetical protein